MALKHAVLGLVIERPSYGYQLAQRLDERFPSGGWQKAGIYGALDSLEGAGLVAGNAGRRRGGDTGRGPPRKVYRVTEPGRGFFRDWIRGPSPFSPSRQELDMKIQLANPELWPALIDQSWGQESYCIAELQTLTRATQRPSSGLSLTWAETSAVLQRNAEIKLLEVRIAWLQEARQAMKLMLERCGRAV
jgi:DNA-binding PadR family transcriptional regulator